MANGGPTLPDPFLAFVIWDGTKSSESGVSRNSHRTIWRQVTTQTSGENIGVSAAMVVARRRPLGVAEEVEPHRCEHVDLHRFRAALLPPVRVIRPPPLACHDCPMLTQLSDQIADVVNRAASSVVQVQGHRAPASGIIYQPDLVLTTARAVGREERPRVQRSDGQTFDADIAGWDPATRLVLLKVPALAGSPLSPGAQPRVGHIAIAIARSWSNSVTATVGLISVIGGPLATGRHRQIDQVFRTSAPMHDGFAGGAVLDANASLLGIATAASIRGLSVVIPASIAWTIAAELVNRGTLKRGYLGISTHPVNVTPQQRSAGAGEESLLVVNVKDRTPASQAALLVGDLLLSLDGHPLTTTDDLFDLLVGERVGRPVTLRLLRGDAPLDVTVTIAER